MVAPCPHLPLLVASLFYLVLVTQAAGWRGVVGRVEVRTEISQRYSSTLCRITLHNPHPKADHVTLAMVLPADAYVSSLTIEAGGRNITTKVEEKRRTRGPKTSEDTRATSRSSRYFPQETQRFKASIKVAPLDQATFYIAYEELLQRARGRYTFSLHLPPYSGTGRQQVEVRLKEKDAIQNLLVLKEPKPSAVTQERISENEVVLTYQRGEEEGRRGEEEETREEERNHLVNTTSNAHNTSRGEEVATSNSSSNSSSSSSSRSVRSVKNEESNKTEAKNVLSLSYDVQRSVDGGEVQVLGRFFVHYLSPEGLPKLPAHTVFALDISGSMSDHGKLDQLKEAIIAIIRRMPEEDSFEVLVFSTRVKSLGVYQALPDQVERGVAKIQALRALGGTNINDALLKAVTGANTHNSTHAPARQVVFLTDGKPNIGETNPEQLRRNVREANRHQLPVFSLALGEDADVRLLRQVSADNEGFTRTLNEEEQPGQEMQEFYKEIATPLLTDLDVMYRDDVVDRNSIIRHGPSNFYSGSEVVFAGQLREGVKEVHPVVAGRGKQGPLQLRVSRTYKSDQELPRDNHVERLWAYLSVQDLLDAVEIVDDRNLRMEMRARAKEIAVRYQFVTKLTTLKAEDSYDSQTHPGLKSASRHQKSRTGIHGGLMGQDLALLSPSEIADTLPAPLSNRIRTSSPNAESFGDNDPHFVVQVPGMSLPFCFDIHASSGSTLSLIRDPHSGVVVNGQVTAAVGRPGNTYFTSIFISLGGVNFTITNTDVSADCLDPRGTPTVDGVSPSLWGKSKKKGRKRNRRKKEQRMKRKSNRANRRSRRGRRNRKGRRSSRNKHSRRRRERRSPYPRVPGVPQGQSPRETPPHYFWRRLSRSIQSKGSTEGEIHSQATFIHPHAFHPFTIGTQTMPHPLASTQALHPFAARYRVMPHPLPYIRAPNQVIHPSHASSQATHTHTSPYTQQNLIHPLHTRLNSKPHPETSTHTQRQSLHNPHTHSHPQSPTYTQKNPSHTTHTNPNNIPTPLASTRTLHRITAPHTHLQTHSNPQTTNEVKYQSPLESTHSRHVRESPRHRQVHPQEGEFTHPQAGVDISAPRFLHGARQGRGGDQAQRKQERERNQLLKECSKTQSWRKLAGRRYGPVMVSLRNHRKLAFLLGDVDLSLVVTRSRSSHGQHFLGVYLERHSLLSPNTTGIIGQFVYKTVGTVGQERPGTTNATHPNSSVRLAVVQLGPERTYQVSEVNAYLSSRRSLLHKTKVSCLYIKNQGRGLVAGGPSDYLRPCLAC